MKCKHLKEQQALRVAANTKRKKGEQSTDYPDAYTKLYNDAVVQEKQSNAKQSKSN